MYPVSQAFLNAIDNANMQHVRATIVQADGTELTFEDNDFTESPVVNRQCTEDADTFSFGQMYVGTAEIVIDLEGMSSTSTNRFKGGELQLEFGIDVDGSNEPEWIPIGVYDISEPIAEPGKRIRIKAVDRLSRLQCNTQHLGDGMLRLEDVLEYVSTLANVEFAQTAEQIAAMIDRELYTFFKIGWDKTCWEEVIRIAQVIGGFAFANREGKIEFRQFKKPFRAAMFIPMSKMRDAKLTEYLYTIYSVTHTDGTYSYTCEQKDRYSQVYAQITIENNKYFSTSNNNENNFAEKWKPHLERIIEVFEKLRWRPGTISWYGNPALDLGDVIEIENSPGSYREFFLITADTWQFRAPQTLISAGAVESGMSSSSSGGGTAAASMTYINTTKKIGRVDFATSEIQLYEAERTVASGSYSVRDQSCCFVVAQLTMLADEDSTSGIVVYHDDIAQDYRALQTLREGEYQTINVSIPINASTGTHTVRVAAYGKAVVKAASAYIWGQELHKESPQYTSDSDYTYTVSDGITTVTGYIGTSLYPEIPTKLGGGATTIIDDHAFTDSDITAVFIPEGVTEIR